MQAFRFSQTWHSDVMARGGIQARFAEDRIDGPAAWTIEGDAHLLILHEAGCYRRLETWLDGHRTSLGEPLPGEMWLAPAGRRYTGRALGGRVRYAVVEIPASRLPIPPRARMLAGHQDRALAALVLAMLAGEGAAADPLLTLLAETLADTAGAPPSPQHVAARIDALLAYIEGHIDAPLTVEDMAADVGMSVNSLIIHFARATGRTPAQYLLHQRLRRARCYLMRGAQSVADIAFATGFSSHAHLCTAFRDKIGMSPTEWRRRAQREMPA